MFQRLVLASALWLVGSGAAFAQVAKEASAAKPSLLPGKPAPALSVEKWVKGSDIAKFEKGKVYVVEFWATWCGPCKASMPHLSALQREFKDKVTIIGVTRKDPRNSLDNVETMVADKGDTMGYTVAWDEDGSTYNDFMTAANQRGIPTAFVVDQSGQVVYINHPMFLDLVLNDVVAGKWDLVKGNARVDDASKKMMAVYQVQNEPKQTLERIAEFEKSFPEIHGQFDSMKYFALLKTGDVAGASKVGAALVDSAIASGDVAALNQIAWSIVDPEAKVEKPDLALALRAAQKGAELSKQKDAAMLDTLARVHFAKGDVAKAIEVQSRAVEVAQGDLKAELEKNLAEYKSKK